MCGGEPSLTSPSRHCDRACAKSPECSVRCVDHDRDVNAPRQLSLSRIHSSAEPGHDECNREFLIQYAPSPAFSGAARLTPLLFIPNIALRVRCERITGGGYDSRTNVEGFMSNACLLYRRIGGSQRAKELQDSASGGRNTTGAGSGRRMGCR